MFRRRNKTQLKKQEQKTMHFPIKPVQADSDVGRFLEEYRKTINCLRKENNELHEKINELREKNNKLSEENAELKARLIPLKETKKAENDTGSCDSEISDSDSGKSGPLEELIEDEKKSSYEPYTLELKLLGKQKSSAPATGKAEPIIAKKEELNLRWRNSV